MTDNTPETHPSPDNILNYAHTRRQIITPRRVVAALLILLVGVAAYSTYRWGIPYAKMAMRRHYENQCLNYLVDPGTIIYTEDPKHIASLAGKSQYQTDTFPTGKAVHLPFPKCLNEFNTWAWRPVTRPPSSGETVLFLHERVTTTGRRVLAYVTYVPQGRAEITSIAYDPSTSTDPPRGGPTFTHSFIPSANPARLVTFFAGQPDPADNSRFTVPFEINGRRGTLKFRVEEYAEPDHPFRDVSPYRAIMIESSDNFRLP